MGMDDFMIFEEEEVIIVGSRVLMNEMMVLMLCDFEGIVLEFVNNMGDFYFVMIV